MEKYRFSVGYQTKIVELSSVNLVGKLEYKIGDEESYWVITDRDAKRRLEEWLDKFDGRQVRILIEALGEDDDTKLLEGQKIEAH